MINNKDLNVIAEFLQKHQDLLNTYKYIDDQSLSDCNCLNSIIFTGTVTQWNDMKKHERWNRGTDISVIHCSDGDTNL